jgi:signal transduction histidine kinase
MNVQRAPTAMAERRDRRGPARLRGRGLLLARGAWLAVVVLTLAIFFASLPRFWAQLQTVCVVPDAYGTGCAFLQLSPAQVAVLRGVGLSPGDYAAYTLALALAMLAACLAVSALIAWRRPDDPMALLVALMLLTLAPQGESTDVMANSAVPMPIPNACLYVLFCALFVLVFSLFPSGHFVPRWTRWPALVSIAAQIPFAVFYAFIPTAPPATKLLAQGFAWAVLLGEGAILVAAQGYRYRRVSTPVERQQTKWVVLGFAVPNTVYVGGTLLSVLVPALAHPALAQPGSPYGARYQLAWISVSNVVQLLLPLAFGFAVLRSRLFDIDTILNRTLVYGGLTGIVVGSYVLIVSALGALFQARGNVLIALVATGVIAVLFQPLRSGLQRLVDRLFFGERDNPYAVLSRLGRRLETALAPEVVLPTIVETVAQALKLPAAVIEIHEDDHSRVAAAYGAQHTAVITFPLLYQSEIVGQLRVAPRAPDELLTRDDKRLMEDIAHQAGVAVHATRLTLDLQHSRERLVSAREEERRRLRRDLHDGLGPTLAGQTLKVGAIRNLLTRDPSAADRLLLELGGEIEVSIADIRRLVYALRPPALDELGLVAALRAEATRHGTEEHGVSGSGGDREAKLRVTVDAPQTLPPLPAAVEVAAYRIACEALTNTIRHAQATACHIRLTLNDALRVEITDDGMGLPVERRVGVGLVSMRERAEELGGACVITSAPGRGVQVLATLPLEKE